MNDLNELEDRLRQLPLRAPSPSLDRRVLRRRRWLLPAIAAGLLLALIPAIYLYRSAGSTSQVVADGTGQAAPQRDPADGAGATARPAGASSEPAVVEYDSAVATYQGFVERENLPPLLVYRVQTLEGVQWEDLTQGVTIQKANMTEHLAFVSAEVY